MNFCLFLVMFSLYTHIQAFARTLIRLAIDVMNEMNVDAGNAESSGKTTLLRNSIPIELFRVDIHFLHYAVYNCNFFFIFTVLRKTFFGVFQFLHKEYLPPLAS